MSEVSKLVIQYSFPTMIFCLMGQKSEREGVLYVSGGLVNILWRGHPVGPRERERLPI